MGRKQTTDVRFEDYAEDYLAHSERDHTRSTARTRQSLVAGKLVPFFRGRTLAEIGPLDIEALLAANADSRPATRNRLLSALSAMLARAVELGLLRHNPARGHRRAREDVAPLPLVSLGDQEKLIDALPTRMQPLFLALLDTGARSGEMLRLTWSDVELDTRSLRLRQTKSRRPRIVRTSERLARRLDRLRPDGVAGATPAFPEALGGDGALRWSWRMAFKRAAHAIGQPELRVHDLRHLTAINLVRAGVDLPTVQAHLGHKHLISTLRYAAYADATASARAARALDRLHGSGPGSEAP